MNITKEDVDKLNAVLKVHIEKKDYEPEVEKVLRDYKRKAKLNGFRPGKVPFGLVKKMYGKQVLVEQVNKLVSESISGYLKDEDIKILGEPLINEEKQESIDWENQQEFNFVFDLGLTPDINIKLGQKDKITFHTIKVDDELINEQIENYKQQFGSFQQVDAIENEEMLKGDIKELDENGQHKEEGITAENAILALNVVKDDSIKKKFKGAKKGDKIIFNLKKAYPNDADVASLLSIDKEIAANLTADFEVTINEINRFQKAEANQELFDKLYGEGEVKSENEFKEKVKEQIKTSLIKDSEYKFNQDAKNLILKKANIELPEDFLKRWILSTNNENTTKEKLDEDFENHRDEFKWQVIKNNIIKENDLKVSEQEVKELAKQVALMQFQQYGMVNLPEEQLAQFADEMLKKDEERRRLYEKLYEDKIFEFIKNNVTVENKEINKEKFKKLLEKNNPTK